MILSSSTGGNEGSGLDLGLLQSSLQSLEDFTLGEHLAEIYTCYGAIHSASELPVWVHHFHQVDMDVLAKLEVQLERLKHLHLEPCLRPLGHVKLEGGLLLVTDASDGQRLDTLLDKVEPATARSWAGDLSKALQLLHEAGEVHGRLCPQSIYITEHGPKLLGAGYADLWAPVWTAMDSDGKLPPRLFTSLEVRLDGIDHAAAPADVFSLGMILYRCYTKMFPGEFCPLPSDKAEVPRSVDGAVMVSMHPEAASRQHSRR